MSRDPLELKREDVEDIPFYEFLSKRREETEFLFYATSRNRAFMPQLLLGKNLTYNALAFYNGLVTKKNVHFSGELHKELCNLDFLDLFLMMEKSEEEFGPQYFEFAVVAMDGQARYGLVQIDDAKKGFILDGFPRTLKQAQALDEALKKESIYIDLILYFETSPEVAIARLSGRSVCKVCGYNYHISNIPPKKTGICDQCGGGLFQRPDDKEETVRNRLKVYEDQTKPLVDYYIKEGILRKVSGDLDVKELLHVLSKIFAEAKLA